MSSRITTNPNGYTEAANCHTPAPTVPPSPHLSIYRNAYNVADFNKTFDALEAKNVSAKSRIGQHFRSNCSAAAWTKRIRTIFPFTDWLVNYNFKSSIVADLLVGITVAVFQVPQSMGYCLIAQVPPVHGLYTAFFPPLIYTIFGTSRHCAVGAFAIVSGVMTGNLVIQVMRENGIDLEAENGNLTAILAGSVSNLTTMSDRPLETIQVATAASLCMGIYLAFFGIFRLGFVSIYLSEQLISGFSSAASIYVFTSQLRYLLGVDYAHRSGLFAIILSFADVFERFDEIQLQAAFISLSCIAILLLFKLYVNEKIKQKTGFKVPFPIELFVVIGGTLLSNILDFESKGVKVVGEIKQGLPYPELPRFDVMSQVMWRSIPLAAVGYTITLSVGKLFGAKHGYTVNANQELVALGATNLVGSVFGCIPSAASLPRSAIQENCGGKTQLVSLVNCAALLVVLLFLGPLLEKLPNCVLGSVIAVALITLLTQLRDFKRYWTVSKLDGSMWLSSFLGVIILDVDNGLYFSLVYSLLVLVYKSSRPKTYLLGSINKTDVYVPIKNYGSAEQRDRIKIYQFCGPLHFSSIEFFKKDLIKKTQVSVTGIIADRKKREHNFKKVAIQFEESYRVVTVSRPPSSVSGQKESIPTHIIIDCSMISYIDTSGIATLKKTVQEFELIGITTFLAGCAPHVIDMLERDLFFIDVPPHHVYISVHDAVLYAIGEQTSNNNGGGYDETLPNLAEDRDDENRTLNESTTSSLTFPRNRF
ncbi:Prestin [Halotydeus destructor]|nr:Prestin [Halotydeus destructor]